MSIKPRKQTTSPSAATIDQNHDQPSVWFSQTTTAGAVISATTVAARVSLRHWLASSAELSACCNPPIGCASVATFEA
jgi:hypothetical protein